MKKHFLIVYILLASIVTLGAVSPPASVRITLTTAVPGYLLHGFLTAPGTPDFVDNPSIDDAFNPQGVVLNYGIKTNSSQPLVVKATINPFEEQDVVNPATVPIDKVKIDGNVISPSLGKYVISEFTPSSGTLFYEYTLTVLVDQNTVMASPTGNYVSTVELAIESGS